MVFRFAGFELEEALARAEAAHELARTLGDPDVEALGLLYRGLVLLALGDVRCGVELLDEAGAAVLAEAVRPWTGGLVYCGVIWGCLNRGDWRRASEGNDPFTRWCSANGVCGYPCRMASARLRPAAALAAGGDAEGAELEIAATEAAYREAGLEALLERCHRARRELAAELLGRAS